MLKKTAGLRAGVVGEETTLGTGLGLDELNAGRDSEDKRSGGKHTGLEAGGRDDGDLTAAMGDRAAGAGIDDVAVAHAIDNDTAEVIAGGGDTLPARDGEGAFSVAGALRILEADVPGGATGG